MTQEEKAKRYDEVLAMAKECLKDGTITSTATGYIETIFPELKKSEDESIIRDICVVLESSATRIFKEKGQMPVWYDRAIAWLEKQGEQKPQGKSALEALNEEKVDNANKVEPKDYNGIDPHFGKPNDKVEPKFHVGDWIVDMEDRELFYVSKVLDSTYELVASANDGDDYHMPHYTVDDNYRLWTINDAKDGDILVSKSGNKIFSYRGNLNLRGNPCAYYGIYKVHDGICFTPCAIGNSFTDEEVFPATKEQRRALFEEKTAAGGVLHFSKKEWETIGQKHVDEPSAFKDKLLELFQKFRYIKEGMPTNGDIIDYVDAHIQELIDIIQNKPWSEEDERWREAIIDVLVNNTQSGEDGVNVYSEEISWLKSLKERYIWKPSDEQMKVCKEVYADLLSAKGFDLGTVNSELNRLEEQLKKLEK